MATGLFITRGGLHCPVGHHYEAAAAAMRGGLDVFGELPYLDPHFEPILGSITASISADVRGPDRLLALVTPAAKEALEGLTPRERAEVPLLLCLRGEERPGFSLPQGRALLRALGEALSLRPHRGSKVVPYGNTAAFVALKEAQTLLQSRGAKRVLIAAADSFIDAQTLLWLHTADRLKTPANSDGVIPGEAGAAALVEAAPEDRGQGALEILGLGFGREPAQLSNELPLRAEGLSTACHGALQDAGLGYEAVGLRLSDIAGESFAFKEQALCVARLLRTRKEDLPLWLPAEHLGETGAAAGLLQCLTMLRAGHRGYAPALTALGHTSALGEERAAAMMRCHS